GTNPGPESETSRPRRGKLVDWAENFLHITLKTVSRPKGAKGFVVLPRRWRVERTLGWIMNARRNARDYERLPQHSEAQMPRRAREACLATTARSTICTKILLSMPTNPAAVWRLGRRLPISRSRRSPGLQSR
ncbi:transposase, partial [Streptomyces sp. NPDC005009]